MIIYDLNCAAGHHFEGWFNGPDEYVSQKAHGLLTCPVCHSTEIRRLPSASHVKAPSSSSDAHKQSPTGQELIPAKAIQALHRYIDENFADVGATFPEEARKIHYGEADARNIRGVATPEDVTALREEGVEVYTLPPRPKDKEKLN